MSDPLNMNEGAWARIIPFLRHLEPLLRDAEITDILVNGEHGVFFEKDGKIEHARGIQIREQSLRVAARNIAAAVQRTGGAAPGVQRTTGARTTGRRQGCV